MLCLAIKRILQKSSRITQVSILSKIERNYDMISPVRNCMPPFTLPSNVVYFHDWRYIHHGNVGYTPATPDTPIELWTTKPVPPLQYTPQLLPTGIFLKAQQAGKTEPFYNEFLHFDSLLLNRSLSSSSAFL